MNPSLSIGIFDSGVGGLTVAKAVRKLMPKENIVYFGDSIHLPYGNKSEENILEYSEKNIRFLLRQKVKVVVVACNTSTAVALPTLLKKYAFPIIGVVEPGAKEALKRTKSAKIGVIGTFRTIHSNAYKKAIEALRKRAKVRQKACPLLVPMIEEGFRKKEILEGVIRAYIDPLANDVDSIVLGCTHYPLIKNNMKKLYPRLQFIDSAQATAKDLDATLKKHALHAHGNRGKLRIYTNDRNEVFAKIAKTLFPQDKTWLIKETQ